MSLVVSQVCKRINGVDILKDISFSVSSGSVVGLSGVNGSGKTMIMRAVAGLIRPSSGTIEVDGQVLGKDIEFPPSLGVLIENPSFLSNRTAAANLKLLASIKGKVGEPTIAKVLHAVGLDAQDRRKFKSFSLGMKQRLGIAAAVMESPDLLLLDEPTNALDREGVEMVKRMIRWARGRGASVLLACHDRSILRELSDEIYYIAEGHIDGHEELAS